MRVDKSKAERARVFFTSKWKQYRKAKDLTGACVFATAFAQHIFGGRYIGNWHHIFLKVGREIIDLTQATGVKEQAEERMALINKYGKAWLPPFFQGVDPNPYLVQDKFLKSRDFKDTWKSVLPRAIEWADEFIRLDETL